ncbi:MAG: accessory factor UbiK family protein [Rhodospirillales bacterium]|jgi:BMFP domain-containing protein YqiC|nr:accessory factor UbiK family protein [Rhodospirillales bacterium]MDP6646513.1 accessory factor UbiK family protein [Rhodospirillales bacterium]MDP6840154.1 accessory factor UbiK family protein [Rhodospirillales bacterium]
MMQTRNRIFDDIAKVANSAAGTFAGLKDEVEGLVRGRIESLISELDLVSREDFDAAMAIAVKAREEQEKLEKKLAALEKEIKSRKPAPAKPRKKPAARKKPTAS